MDPLEPWHSVEEDLHKKTPSELMWKTKSDTFQTTPTSLKLGDGKAARKKCITRIT